MQHRMKTHQLTEKETESLLLDCLTGALATVNPERIPYNVPVHYVFCHNVIYIHGLPAGQKIDNMNEKKAALLAIIQKYTPHLAEKEIPFNMLKGTAVIKLSVSKMTGKYYS